MMICYVCKDKKSVTLLNGPVPCTDCPKEPAPESPNGGTITMRPYVDAAVQLSGTPTSAPAEVDEPLAMISVTKIIPAWTTEFVVLGSTQSPYFEPKYAMIIIIDPSNPSDFRRAAVRDIQICGIRQEDYVGIVPSDVYREWMRVPWGTFAARYLGQGELSMMIDNPHAYQITATLVVRGRPRQICSPSEFGRPKKIS